MQSRRSNKAVSEVVGTMLLLVLAISALSLIYFQVLSDDGPDSRTIVKIVGKVEGTDVVLEHQGGEPLELDTEISITIAGTEYNGDVSEWLNDENNNGKWNLGERMIFPFKYNLSRLGDYTKVDLMAIDHEDNSIVFMGPIELHPVSDIGIEITVDDGTPEIGEIIEITITVTSYGGDVNGSGNVIVKYLLSGGLIYDDNTSSQGIYNNETGIWEIGNVLVGTPAILKINATVVGIPTREFMQLAMVLDGSSSITNDDWDVMRTGLAAAVGNESVFPYDGSVELTIIQFGGDHPTGSHPDRIPHARVEIGPMNITDNSVVADIQTLERIISDDGETPIVCGFMLAADVLSGDPDGNLVGTPEEGKASVNFDSVNRRVVCLVTDGMPNCVLIPGTYTATWMGNDAASYTVSKESAEEGRGYIETMLGIEATDDQDELDCLAVGGSMYGGPDLDWLNSSIVLPQPGYIAPPFDNGTGWVCYVENWQQFESAVNEMFQVLFNSISSNVELVDSTTLDPNDRNNNAVLIILPEEKPTS